MKKVMWRIRHKLVALGVSTLCAPVWAIAQNQNGPADEQAVEEAVREAEPAPSADEAAEEAEPAPLTSLTEELEPAPWVEEVIVYARRRDAELSIAAKREADQIVDAISADQASRFPDNTMAEALGRIPGVSFRRSGITGNGNFISIRGLDSALNAISFDGVQASINTPYDRRVALDGITTENIAELRIIKSLMPRDPGTGIGGAVEVTSRKPLDYEEDHLSATFEMRYGEFAEKWGSRGRVSFAHLFNEDLGVNVSVSHRRRHLHNYEIHASSSNLLYLPPLTDAGGNAVDTDFILAELDDPGRSFNRVTAGFFPLDAITNEEQVYRVQRQRRDTLSVSSAVEWQMTGRTNLLLGGRYNRQESLSTENFISFDSDDGWFELIDGVLRTVFLAPRINFVSKVEDDDEVNGSAYLKGVTEFDRLTLSYQLSYAQSDYVPPGALIYFDTGGLLGDETARFVPFSYTGRYFPVPNSSVSSDPDFQRAVQDMPGTQMLSFIEAENQIRQTSNRYGMQIDAEYVPSAGFLGGALSIIEAGAEFEQLNVSDEQYTLGLDGSFHPNGPGAFLENFDGLFGGFIDLGPIGDPLRSIGIDGIPALNERALRRLAKTFKDSFDASGFERVPPHFSDVEESLFTGYVQAGGRIGRLEAAGGLRVEHYRAEIAGPLEPRAFLVTRNIIDPDDPSLVGDSLIDLRAPGIRAVNRSESSNTEILPRANLRYSVNDSFQLRAGLGYSLARPSFGQLGGNSYIDLLLTAEAGEPGGEPVLPGATTAAEALAAGGLRPDQLTDIDIRIYTGNPDLDNARSLNLDLSLEYYPSSDTMVSLALFHKAIDNFIFIGSQSTSGGLSLDLANGVLSPAGQALIEQLGGLENLIRSPAVDELDISQPLNGEKGIVYGTELGFRHQLGWARGWLSGIGLSGSVAYTRSKAEIPVLGAEAATPVNPNGGLREFDALVALGYAERGDGLYRERPFHNSPAWSANAVAYYQSDLLEISLSYTYQDRLFLHTDDFGFDLYDAGSSQLDFYAEYEFAPREGGGDYSAYLEIPDITDSGRKPTYLQTLGPTRQVINAASFNGREFHLGLRIQF